MRSFIINMKKDVQRKKDMTFQMEKANINYEFFEGVDGKLISNQLIQEISDEVQLTSSHNRPFDELRGLIGCTYSHYLIYQKMIKENIEVACILEDDVILSNEFKDQLEWVGREILQNEIVSLHTLLYDPVEFIVTKRANTSCTICIPSPPKIRGTQGYVITQYCAQQLMKEMMPIKEFPDCFNRYHLFCPDVQIRVLYPFIIRHMWIDSVRDDKKFGLKSKVLNYIQAHRVFPFWNLIRTRRRKINDQYISSFINFKNQGIEQLYVSDLNKTSLISQL